MKKQLSILIFLMTALQPGLHAQDTMRIDVLKPFIATLGEAIKIQSNPNPEIPVVVNDTFVYPTPVIERVDIPTAYTIKPLSLGTSLLPKLKNNYVRLGYGNYNTPLIELYLNTTRNRNYQAGAFVKHLSSSPSDGRKFSNNTVSTFGKRFINKSVLEGDLMFHQNVVNRYGFAFPDGSYNAAANSPGNTATENVYSLLQFQTAFSNVLKDTSKLGYDLRAVYYRFGTNYDLHEDDFRLSGTFQQSVQGNPLQVITALQTNSIVHSVTSNTYSRVFVDIHPTYRLLIDRAYLMVGFNSTFFNDSNGTKFLFFPQAELGYKLIPNSITAYAGFTGGLQRHTLRSLTTENPFLRGFVLNNTVNQFEMYIGLKGIISPQTSFVMEASLATIRNMVFYAADSLLNQQAVVYDPSKAGLSRIKAELNHEFGEQFRFGFVMQYFGYDLSITAPYSRPTFTTALNVLYAIGSKFNLRTEFFTMNKRTGLQLPSNMEYALKGLVDINAGLDYRYNRNVKVFLNINNLTNNEYQRWLNLPVLGINVVGGLGITF
ncbi:MAG: TonB-dependent receptor [Bacteroidia bacterium]|jgi:hypothetical protein